MRLHVVDPRGILTRQSVSAVNAIWIAISKVGMVASEISRVSSILVFLFSREIDPVFVDLDEKFSAAGTVCPVVIANES